MLIKLIVVSSVVELFLYQPRKIINFTDSHFCKDRNRNEVVYQGITISRTISVEPSVPLCIGNILFSVINSFPIAVLLSIFTRKALSARFIFAAFVLLNCQALNIVLAFHIAAVLIVVLVSG